MRKIREILRLRCEAGLTGRAIARAVGVSNSTVSGLFARADLAGLAWPLPEGVTDAELEERLYRDRYQPVGDPREPDWARVHEELRTHKHLTLRQVWLEYRAEHPEGYGYSWYWSCPASVDRSAPTQTRPPVRSLQASSRSRRGSAARGQSVVCADCRTPRCS